ncbi:MAG: hypothetical protein KF789_07305 [Bdellovibrionaceae bacterium]|nr:hypothetical protein [Pseudobdellovibrionaceae bacterium]
MKTHQLLVLALIAVGLSACKQECTTGGTSKEASASAATREVASSSVSIECSEPSQPSPGEPPVTNPPQTEPEKPYSFHPLLWESVRSEGKAWSAYLHELIEKDLGNDLLAGSEDIETFCPRYHTLNNKQRVNFWGLLISAMTKYESAHNPLSRMQETTMGTDPVTKKPVYSEGLLQLSYQDIQWAPYCEFDWEKDKNLSPTDPKKTILDPYKNLNCGTRIFARQIRNKRNIAVKSGAYWSVLIPGGKYTKVTQISDLTKKLPGCQ